MTAPLETASGLPPPGTGPVVRAPEAQALAATWAADLDILAAEMFDFLAAGIPELRDDEEIRSLTFASCASNAEVVLSMMRTGIPADRTEAPVSALEHARQMAVRGADIDALLRFYRLGHHYFSTRWSEALLGRVGEPDRLAGVLRESSEFLFTYLDVVSSKVSTEHTAERDRRQRRAATNRRDAVAAILAGEAVDMDTVEQALGHRLDHPQVAFLCWTEGDDARLEAAAQAAVGALGASRSLLHAEGRGVFAGWAFVTGEEALDAGAVASAVASAAPEVHVALGDVGSGIEGFRRTRQRAQGARRVAELSGRRPPSVTRWVDVALVETLSADLDAARALVQAELGRLVEQDARTAVLRAALLAHVQAQGSHVAAAAALGVHRNTALQRVRRAEELRVRPAGDRPAELYAALLLAEVLGAVVLVC